MKTLLVPLDFSNGTGILLKHAAELARVIGARISLFHVIEPIATYIPVGASMDVLAAPLLGDPLDQETLQKRLEGLAEPLRAAGLTVEANTLVGMAVQEILNRAELENADYILLGSHGRGALYHLFAGSVVTGVLKKSTRPVIVIPVAKIADKPAQ